MKTINITLALMLSVTLFSCNTNNDETEVTDKLFSIIPAPVSLEKFNGSFLIDSTTRIIFDPKLPELKQLAGFLNEHIFNMYGLQLNISDINTAGIENVIYLKISNDSIEEEAYSLHISAPNVTIEADNTKGLFYGIQTLFQLLPAQQSKCENLELDCLYIFDKPKYKWRGMHLDVCRHFFPVSFIKKMIDLIAMHKMNTFHWHLTEDQGWRIEIKKYPLLTQIGAWRDETVIGHISGHPLEYDGKTYGGFYTQEQIKEVVAYAKSRYVTIVPEIELPGHSIAALSAYPEYSCTGGPFSVYTKWGISSDVFCPGNEETFEFLENILTEVVELFPGEYIHIGGDECSKKRWKKCSDCQKRIKDEGLKNTFELQSYFVKRIEKFLNSKGKKLIGWDEILEGGLPERATVMSWRGTNGGIKAAIQGHDVVMTPNSHCYFDHYQSRENEPLAIGGLTSFEDVYCFDPMPEELTQQQANHIIGAQANVWTEYIPDKKHVEYMVFPRLCALSEVLWSPENVQNWDNFITRMDKHYLRLDQKNINYRIATPYGFEAINKFLENSVEITLTCDISDAEIHYTTDGTEPVIESPLYHKPLILDIEKKIELKARTFLPSGKMSSVKTGTFEKITMIEPVEIENLKSGLKFKYFEGEFESAKKIIGKHKTTGVLKKLILPRKTLKHFFGLKYSGYINIPADGYYTFYLKSSDGSVLYIANQLVVDNDGCQFNGEKQGNIALKKGLHPVKLDYFQAKYRKFLIVEYECPGFEKREIPPDVLSH
jgi:hexosaminidase